MVQILRSSTSKSAPKPSIFNGFDFHIVLACRRGATFAKLNFQKCQFLTILACKSLSHAAVVQILRSSTSKSAPNMQRGAFFFFFQKLLSRADVAQILRSSTSKSAPTPPDFNDSNFQIALARRRGANFQPSKPQNYGKPSQHFVQFLPAKISHVSHRDCETSLLCTIDAVRPSHNVQYSRKLALLSFFWPEAKYKTRWNFARKS